MSNIAVEFNHVGKQYRLGRVGTGTLGHDLNRWWYTTILRREDPYLKIGESNDRAHKGDSDYVWALKDISFKIEQGDVVGFIGKNGAGKSTLLKLLSQITTPSTGTIDTWGRIGSLLEVGTGFHPEMTGRENIFMNGSILGMTKTEIKSKLDEIVDFSGVERYLDTPVKRYSSGMIVRLGFAVAAFLEPEILVVDEVLTVGDAEFQKKALGKMNDVAGDGRTVLFVSHNMGAVRRLCKSAIVLENGNLTMQGAVEDAIKYYLMENDDDSVDSNNLLSAKRPKGLGGLARFKRIEYLDEQGEYTKPTTGKYLHIKIYIDSMVSGKNADISFQIHNIFGEPMIWYNSSAKNEAIKLNHGENVINLFIEKLPVSDGKYNIELRCAIDGISQDSITDGISMNVADGIFFSELSEVPSRLRGRIVLSEHDWSL